MTEPGKSSSHFLKRRDFTFVQTSLGTKNETDGLMGRIENSMEAFRMMILMMKDDGGATSTQLGYHAVEVDRLTYFGKSGPSRLHHGLFRYGLPTKSNIGLHFPNDAILCDPGTPTRDTAFNRSAQYIVQLAPFECGRKEMHFRLRIRERCKLLPGTDQPIVLDSFDQNSSFLSGRIDSPKHMSHGQAPNPHQVMIGFLIENYSGIGRGRFR